MIKKILVLGANGMLGHVIFTELSKQKEFEVYGTVLSLNGFKKFFSPKLIKMIRDKVDINNFKSVTKTFTVIKPHIVINCIGLIKQLPSANDAIKAITLNALLPHRLAQLCETKKSRMIHFSTDCVFSGKTGNYKENDLSDAQDLYGRTKFLGEVSYPHTFTFRTSIIGHELASKNGLLEWFLSQRESVNGFTKVIYSGFPTVEIANILTNSVIPHPELHGVYHISSDPISKYELLKLIAKEYHKEIKFIPYDKKVADMSLDSSKFRKATGYTPPSWPELIKKMYKHYKSSKLYTNKFNF